MQQQHASTRPATQHQHNTSVVGTRSPTVTTAAQQYVPDTDAADADQSMIPPSRVSFCPGRRSSYIVELTTPGTRYELCSHT